MSETNQTEEKPQGETQPEGTQEAREAVDAILSKIDYDKISKNDVFHDIMHQSKLFAFRLMVGAALLEQLIMREAVKEAQPEGEAKPEEAAPDAASEEPKVEVLPDPPQEDQDGE